MSERILKALMQLFAIIARPEDDSGNDRRTIVESFLKEQLNTALVIAYLKVFDEYYEEYQKRHQDGTKKTKKINAFISVRVLRIANDINQELVQSQKVIVVIRLLEFIKSGKDNITEQELEFVEAVATSFNIPIEEYELIRLFVLNSLAQIPGSEYKLVIDSSKDFTEEPTKHIYSSQLAGAIVILHISSTNMHVMRFAGERELSINGQLLKPQKVHVLSVGASIRSPRITPIYYGDIISTFNADKIKSKILFECKNIEYRFASGKLGLHNLSFSEESGRLVGIMGASGAGKSTLLSVVNGSAMPTSGEILVNGINIHKEKNKIEGIIGFVSQDDLLIEELTVFQNLYYNAKLCFGNYSDESIVESVDNILLSLGLLEIKDMKVGSPLNKKISGGQRKRLNIALELIREPSILFLDEPTSGLSSRDSENILDLLKELSLKGKLVLVVIHQPSSDIFKMFDRLLILDTGGYLIYNGDPIDSIIYFKSRIRQADWSESECSVCGNVNPEQIFNIVEASVVDEFGNLTHTRKVLPEEWNKFYHQYNHQPESKETGGDLALPEVNFKVPSWFNQFLVFVKRDVLSKLTDTQYLIINFFEAPLLAFILSYIIRYYDLKVENIAGYAMGDNSNIPVYIFMSVIVALFIGLTVSAEEIIKDRRIQKREEFLNLSRSSYLLSKIAILIVLSAIQAFLFVAVGNSILHIKGMFFEYWLMLFVTWIFANILGLNISDGFKTSVTIYILIPFLIIPQILLSGVIVKFDKLNPDVSSPSSIPWYGEVITARWAYEALAVYQFTQNDYQKHFYAYDKAMSIAVYKKDFWKTTLTNKINSCETMLAEKHRSPQLEADLNLIRNEIVKELEYNKKVKVSFDLRLLTSSKLTSAAVEGVKTYLNDVNEYYKKLYNKANREKDKLLTSMQKTSGQKEEFLKLKREYQNENLKEFVTNWNETDKIIEYSGRLYQKIDPVYLDPENKMIKAHFYAPRKQVFGTFVDTYIVNLFVIVSICIFMYFTLYFQWLKKALDSLERIQMKYFPSKNE